MFEPNDDVTVRVIGDYSELDEACCAAPPFLNQPINVFAPGLLGANVLPETQFERRARFEGNLLTEQELWGASVQLDWWLGSTSSLNSFRDESSASIEIGAKGQLLDGKLTANVAIFDQNIDDFQAVVFNGQNFDLSNAGEISINGFEADVLYRPVDSVVLTAAATYLDGTFDSFPGASCPEIALLPTPVPAQFITCDPTNPAFTDIQDLSGQKILGIPEWSASSTATFFIPIGNLEGFACAEVQFSSGINLAGDQAPPKSRGDLTLVNASFGIGDLEKGWERTFWGKNLFDEEFPQGIFDSVAQPGSLSGYPNDPPLYGITFRLSR